MLGEAMEKQSGAGGAAGAWIGLTVAASPDARVRSARGYYGTGILTRNRSLSKRLRVALPQHALPEDYEGR
jgi:hypothetical protein